MFNWVRKNWFNLLVVSLLLFLLKDKLKPTVSPLSQIASQEKIGQPPSLSSAQLLPPEDQFPPSDNPDRLVVTDTSLSLLVKDVSDSLKQIQSMAESLDGFLVNSQLNQPQSAASGTITVRVPQNQRQQALSQFKKLAVKVVSQTVFGRDVTDQYQDLDARLQTLVKTKSKLEAILNQAARVQDILEVQRQLTSLQSQIDSIKGQQKYLTETAKLTKITVYLSTDELSLPYTPDQAWRPAVIFKTAVRSLVSTFRSLGNLLIWTVVYSPVILPLLLFFWYLKRIGKI